MGCGEEGLAWSRRPALAALGQVPHAAVGFGTCDLLRSATTTASGVRSGAEVSAAGRPMPIQDSGEAQSVMRGRPGVRPSGAWERTENRRSPQLAGTQEGRMAMCWHFRTWRSEGVDEMFCWCKSAEDCLITLFGERIIKMYQVLFGPGIRKVHQNG